MNNINNKIKYIKQLATFRYVIKGQVNAMASLKGGLPLVRIILSVIPIIGMHTTTARVRAIFVFLRHVHFLMKHNGPKGLCLILKVYAVLLQQCIGGMVIPDVTELKFRVSRTNRGLPKVIPKVHRDLIRAGDTATIRLYLTMFNLYRLIDFKGSYKKEDLTKTIVAPAKPGVNFVSFVGMLVFFIPHFWIKLGRLIGMNARALNKELLQEYSLLRLSPLKKSSPFTASLPQGFQELSPLDQEQVMDERPIISSHPLAVHEAAKALDSNTEGLRENALFFLDLIAEKSPIREI